MNICLPVTPRPGPAGATGGSTPMTGQGAAPAAAATGAAAAIVSAMTRAATTAVAAPPPEEPDRPEDQCGETKGGTYVLRDKTGEIIRTGRTNNFVRREAEHACR